MDDMTNKQFVACVAILAAAIMSIVFGAIYTEYKVDMRKCEVAEMAIKNGIEFRYGKVE